MLENLESMSVNRTKELFDCYLQPIDPNHFGEQLAIHVVDTVSDFYRFSHCEYLLVESVKGKSIFEDFESISGQEELEDEVESEAVKGLSTEEFVDEEEMNVEPKTQQTTYEK